VTAKAGSQDNSQGKLLAALTAAAGLCGILVGAGVSWGSTMEEISGMKSELSAIRADLKENRSIMNSRISDLEHRVRIVEIEQARSQQQRNPPISQ